MTRYGVAEGGTGMGPSVGVVSGIDFRTGEPFVNQLILGNNGGPGTPACDGWLTWTLPVCAGLLYRDSVEIDEQKYPLHIEYLRLIPDTGGAGRFRGAPAAEVAYTGRGNPVTVVWVLDSHERPAHGVHGGGAGHRSEAEMVEADGSRTPLPAAGQLDLQPGQLVISVSAGGGGFGDPRERGVHAVLHDVLEGYVTVEAAREIYGVVLTGGRDDDALAIDAESTATLRG